MLFRVAPEDQQDMTYALNGMPVGLRTDGFDHSGTRFPIRGIYADFDQFVIGQGLFNLGQHSLGETGIADDDNRFERMAEAAQVAFLAFVELHDSGPDKRARSIT